ncbi:MAG TPA: hypothetical protein VFC19_17510 [Candidatus Limnocylindrales bacterium]|nr:hypothetical protein [Candidatus Limnocylindrales bacterium]
MLTQTGRKPQQPMLRGCPVLRFTVRHTMRGKGIYCPAGRLR